MGSHIPSNFPLVSFTQQLAMWKCACLLLVALVVIAAEGRDQEAYDAGLKLAKILHDDPEEYNTLTNRLIKARKSGQKRDVRPARFISNALDTIKGVSSIKDGVSQIGQGLGILPTTPPPSLWQRFMNLFGRKKRGVRQPRFFGRFPPRFPNFFRKPTTTTTTTTTTPAPVESPVDELVAMASKYTGTDLMAMFKQYQPVATEMLNQLKPKVFSTWKSINAQSNKLEQTAEQSGQQMVDKAIAMWKKFNDKSEELEQAAEQYGQQVGKKRNVRFFRPFFRKPTTTTPAPPANPFGDVMALVNKLDSNDVVAMVKQYLPMAKAKVKEEIKEWTPVVKEKAKEAVSMWKKFNDKSAKLEQTAEKSSKDLVKKGIAMWKKMNDKSAELEEKAEELGQQVGKKREVREANPWKNWGHKNAWKNTAGRRERIGSWREKTMSRLNNIRNNKMGGFHKDGADAGADGKGMERVINGMANSRKKQKAYLAKLKKAAHEDRMRG